MKLEKEFLENPANAGKILLPQTPYTYTDKSRTHRLLCMYLILGTYPLTLWHYQLNVEDRDRFWLRQPDGFAYIANALCQTVIQDAEQFTSNILGQGKTQQVASYMSPQPIEYCSSLSYYAVRHCFSQEDQDKIACCLTLCQL